MEKVINAQLTLLERKALAFIEAVQNRRNAAEVVHFYHADVQHTEFPNLVTPGKLVRDLPALVSASQSGLKLMQKETYDVKNILSRDNTVVLEMEWRGKLAIDLGKLKAGEEMRAYFAQFFEFKDGKIYRQRNYDCFEPF